MYCFVYYINNLLTRKSRLNFTFKKENTLATIYSENRASDIAAADWPSQTHVKNYRK